MRSKSSGWARKTVFGVAFTSLFVLMALLGSMGQSTQSKAPLSVAQENYSWENPLTRLAYKSFIQMEVFCSNQTLTAEGVMCSLSGLDRAVVILAANGPRLHLG